jgi:hypothetical protein
VSFTVGVRPVNQEEQPKELQLKTTCQGLSAGQVMAAGFPRRGFAARGQNLCL